jgi:hypothetical protein
MYAGVPRPRSETFSNWWRGAAVCGDIAARKLESRWLTFWPRLAGDVGEDGIAAVYACGNDVF